MRGYDVDPVDFVQLLDAFPGGLAAVRSHLADQFGILAGGEDAYHIWKTIEGERGETGAADVVSELVLSKGGDRLRDVVVAASAGREPFLRADDSRLVRLLFEEEDWREPEVGLYVVNYFERSRPPSGGGVADSSDIFDAEVEETEAEEENSDYEDFIEEEADEPDILKLFSGKPRPSALDQATWALERVQAPRRFLTIPAEWSEADLEAFLWERWEELDLGFDYPLYLIDKQVSLGAHTSDRVDLLAQGSKGEWVAIEIKIGEARRGDLTQLLSYMADLERRGERRDLIRGILIAQSFSKKVLNTVAVDSRISLLAFRREA